MTTDGQVLATTLKRFWPDYAEVVGDGLLTRVANDVAAGRGVPAFRDERESGTAFDLKDALTIVGHALTFIKLCFDVYKMLREARRAKPEVDEVQTGVASAAPTVELRQIATSALGADVVKAIVAQSE